jgi:hypothetical protein
MNRHEGRQMGTTFWDMSQYLEPQDIRGLSLHSQRLLPPTSHGMAAHSTGIETLPEMEMGRRATGLTTDSEKESASSLEKNAGAGVYREGSIPSEEGLALPEDGDDPVILTGEDVSKYVDPIEVVNRYLIIYQLCRLSFGFARSCSDFSILLYRNRHSRTRSRIGSDLHLQTSRDRCFPRIPATDHLRYRKSVGGSGTST